MSLINDALNKVQREREALRAASASRSATSADSARPSGRIPPLVWVLINAGVLIVVLAGNHFFFRNPSPAEQPVTRVAPAPTRQPTAAANESRQPRFVAAADAPPRVTAAPMGEAEPVRITPAPQSSGSPFVPLTNSASSTLSADTEYDLAGMTVVGKDTLLSISRRSDQRSFWVPVGKTVGEVTALSYNADNDNAVIRVRGREYTIGMRNASVYFRPVGATN